MPILPRPIHILGDTASSDIPCYIISPDDVISAIRENKTLFLKLLLRLDDTASWLSRQDLFLIKLHALAGDKMQASLRYEIRKKQIEVIKEYLRYLEGAGAKKDAVVNISFLKELLAPLTSKHHPLYNYVVTIEYLAYFNQFMSYLRAGDGLKYEEGTYAFGEEGFAPAVDAALKAKLREDLEKLLTGFRRECELNFVESITIAQLETILKDLESLATAAEAEAKKSKRDYDTVMLEVEAGYAAVKERRDEIESLGRRFEQAMPSTLISHSGMNPSSVDFKKRLIKTFSRAVLDPLADLSYGSIKATPLHFAIHHLQDKLVDLFLAACIDRGENPLGEHQASGKKVIDRRGNTVLHLIAIILNESSTPGDESKLRALIKMFAAILDAAKQIKRGDVSKTSRKESFIQHETEVFILEAFLQKNNDEKTVLELLLAADKREVFALLRTYITPELISHAMEATTSAFETRVYMHLIASEAHLKRFEDAPKNRDIRAASLVSFDDERCKDELGDRLLQRRKALDSLWLALWLASQIGSNAVLVEQIKHCCEKNASYPVLDPRFSWGYALLEPLSIIMNAYIRGALKGQALTSRADLAPAKMAAGSSEPANNGAGKEPREFVTSASKELDLSACGLGGFKFRREAADSYCHRDLGVIPRGLEIVHLCHNGFYEMDDDEGEMVEASVLLACIVLSLPSTVHTLYLEGNGVELYKHDELAALFSKFPKNIKWVSLAGEKPRVLAEQLVRLQWPIDYYVKAAAAAAAGQGAVVGALLRDYAGGNAWWHVKLVSHWHDQYVATIENLLIAKQGQLAPTPAALMMELKKLDQEKEIKARDSLFGRYAFLVHFAAGKIKRPDLATSAGSHSSGARRRTILEAERVEVAKLWPKL